MRPAFVLVLLVTPALAAEPQLEALQTPPGWVVVKNKVTEAVRWHDRNGENVVVVMKRKEDEAEYLSIRHVARADDGAVKELRVLSDAVQGCSEDIALDIVAHSFALTDLDKDGIDEVSFSYLVGCRGDMSPVAMKLMFLENGDKYVMRGEQEMYVRTKRGGLERNNPWETKPPEWEPPLDKANPFRAYMNAKWQRDKKWVFGKE